MREHASVKRGLHYALFFLLAVPVLSGIALAVPAHAEEAPAVPGPSAPAEETAPIALIGFGTTSESNQQYSVSYGAPVDPIDAINPGHYYLVDAGAAASTVRLSGRAIVTYDDLTRTATVTLTDPALSLLREGVSAGVDGVKSLTGNTFVAPTTASAAVLTAPGMPGMPSGVLSADATSIAWAWAAAIDGGSYPSGIAAYAYELYEDGALVTAGVTPADVLTVTTPTNGEGAYSLRVWAVDNVQLQGDGAIAADVIVTAPVTPTDPGVPTTPTTPTTPSEPTEPTEPSVPTVPDTPVTPPTQEPVAEIPAQPAPTPVSVATHYATPAIVSSSIAYSVAAGASPASTEASVLSASSTEKPAVASATDPAPQKMVDVSENGVNVLGIPWFWWLIIAAIIGTAWLWVKSVARRQEDDA